MNDFMEGVGSQLITAITSTHNETLSFDPSREMPISKFKI
jgi:hypothetical protein